VPPPTLQGTVDKEVAAWSALWNSKGPREAPVFPPVPADLPRITPSQLRSAALAFCPRTGVGGDHLHPRWFGHLSDVSLERVCCLYATFEALGTVPSSLWNMLLLYEKAQGGFRPIGLLPIIIRLWEYCRKTYLWD
jgi:hypothetical protein